MSAASLSRSTPDSDSLSRSCNVASEYTRARANERVKRVRLGIRIGVICAYTCAQVCVYVYLCIRARGRHPHKLTSLSRVARLLLACLLACCCRPLAPRIARLHNDVGRSAGFSIALFFAMLLTFPSVVPRFARARCARVRTGEPSRNFKNLDTRKATFIKKEKRNVSDHRRRTKRFPKECRDRSHGFSTNAQ